MTSVPTHRLRLRSRLLTAVRGYRRAIADRLFVRPWRVDATVSEVDQVPQHIRARRAFLVAAKARRKWLVFDCPCGSGHRILLNLDRTRRPFWTLRVAKDRRLTIHPSVDYSDDRRSCHYFLSDGRVKWVTEEGELEVPETLLPNV